jgi:hypothetical protein
VVVVLHPLPDPLLGFLKTPKLRPDQELFIDRLPKPLDFAQRHRMMSLRFDVPDPVLP